MDIEEIINARKEPIWRNLSEEKKNETALQAINYARLLKGMDALEGAQIEFVYSEFVPYIDKHCDSLTAKEILLAIGAGVRMELGNKDNYVNTANAENWLLLYKQSATRCEALGLDKPVTNQPDNVSELNIKAYDDGIHRAYAWYKRSGGYVLNETREEGGVRIPTWARMIYEWFRSIDKIEEPTENDTEIAREYAEQKMKYNQIDKIQDAIAPAIYDDWYKTGLLGCYFSRVSGIPLIIS